MNDLLILTACSQESESADIDRLHSVQSSPLLKDGFMFFTSLRRELQGRSRQTIIVSIGMALAIALVILVNSVSTGVKNAQAEVLQSVYGIGTDITITETPTAPTDGGRGPQQFDFAQGDGSSDGSTQSVATSRLSVSRGTGTLSADDLATALGTSGVNNATGVLSLENTKFSGEIRSQSTDSGTTTQGQMPSGGMGGPGGGSFNVDRFTVLGIDPGVSDIGPMSAIALSDGRLLTADDADANTAVVDSGYATDASLAVGDTLNIGGTNFTIVGIVSSTSTAGTSAANVYIPLAVAQSLAGEDGNLTSIYVQADSSNNLSAIKTALGSALPDATINTQEDIASTVSGSLATASGLISNLGFWLSLAVLVAAFLIATLFTISGVSRRTREFGTLKAIGWKNGRITAQVAGESLVQGIIGGVIGLVVGIGAVLIVNAAGITLSGSTTSAQGFGGFGGGQMPGGGNGAASMPTAAAGMGQMPGMESASSGTSVVLNAALTPSVIAIAIGLAILGGLVAGAFGGWRASRLRPAEALRSVA